MNCVSLVGRDVSPPPADVSQYHSNKNERRHRVCRDRGTRGCGRGGLVPVLLGVLDIPQDEDKHKAPHRPPRPYYLPPRQGVVPTPSIPKPYLNGIAMYRPVSASDSRRYIGGSGDTSRPTHFLQTGSRLLERNQV